MAGLTCQISALLLASMLPEGMVPEFPKASTAGSDSGNR